MSSRILIIDANILIRGVLGSKVRDLIITNSDKVDFFTPEVCIQDAEKYLPILFKKRSLSAEPALRLLSALKSIIQVIDEDVYSEYAEEAQRRMENRDPQDWPIAAAALALNSAIWTEDKDFFGSGFTTWMTAKVHIFFESGKSS
ncbi:MAG: PIN domain-containing protein [Tatlockia sp.]|nr:PIN domain-containing protein [Tatlockia sp.]